MAIPDSFASYAGIRYCAYCHNYTPCPSYKCRKQHLVDSLVGEKSPYNSEFTRVSNHIRKTRGER